MYKNGFIKKAVAVVMTAVMGMNLLCGCGDGDGSEVLPAAFGSYGADFAREFAKKYPYRRSFSEEENAAGIMIEKEFKELGYSVEKQAFNSLYEQTSYNYYVKIEGKGFKQVDSKGNAKDVRRTVIVGAHYDTILGIHDINDEYSYDGISDNASGVGCLMTIASQIKNYDLDFDVYLVAFGAGNENYAGARKFYSSLSEEEKASIDVMFCIDGIYAGDKVYASAGFNSLDLSKKYMMRRKLYQAYDVAYDNTLGSTNDFYLYYNECGIITDLNGDGVDDIYREVSTVKSDYVVFDEADIPIVFFDSGDYFFDDMSKFKETKNLNLQEFDGMISNTYLDSSEFLREVFKSKKDDSDRLEVRINNVSYIIMETIMKGSDNALTLTEYQNLLNEPTVEPTSTGTSTVSSAGGTSVSETDTAGS
ncbi:MAG: M28 family peptidase [Clostridia bacterium]|nr:M28 family peptidase [Clostridia bacterium]